MSQTDMINQIANTANGDETANIIVLPKETKETNPEVIEAKTRAYFRNTPILADVAKCESHFRQFDNDGSIHRGEVNHNDVGVMQINEKYHLDTALRLDIDIYSVEGNLAYAKYLYDKQGVAPWNSSGKCWRKAQIAQK